MSIYQLAAAEILQSLGDFLGKNQKTVFLLLGQPCLGLKLAMWLSGEPVGLWQMEPGLNSMVGTYFLCHLGFILNSSCSISSTVKSGNCILLIGATQVVRITGRFRLHCRSGILLQETQALKEMWQVVTMQEKAAPSWEARPFSWHGFFLSPPLSVSLSPLCLHGFWFFLPFLSLSLLDLMLHSNFTNRENPTGSGGYHQIRSPLGQSSHARLPQTWLGLMDGCLWHRIQSLKPSSVAWPTRSHDIKHGYIVQWGTVLDNLHLLLQINSPFFFTLLCALGLSSGHKKGGTQ